MVVNDQFVFVHLQKTGGAFISETLLKIFPESQLLAPHTSRCDIPQQYQHLPCFGFVRNPWDWYVSWYSYFKNQNYTTPIFGVVSENKKLDFKQTIKNVFDIFYYEQDQDKIQDEIMRHHQTGEAVTSISQRVKNGEVFNVSGGLLGCMFRYAFAKNGEFSDIPYGKVENLREDLIRLLQESGCQLQAGQREYILKNKIINQSSRSDYRTYYDDELAELVNQREKLLINHFHYSF